MYICIYKIIEHINKMRKDDFMKNKKKNKVIIFTVAVAIPLFVGGVAAFLTKDNMDIYETVNTPPLSPPAFLFPVVWTLLYILMGVSSGLIWLKREEEKERAENALLIYAASLVFNFIWSLIFFNFRMYLFSFVWLVALLILILLTVIKYKALSRVAAYLQIPYLLWVAFAGYLNFGIYILNP